MQEVTTYPYSPITSNGLGLSYSSYEKIGAVLNQKSYGGAKLKCWPNLATGNLVFQDRVLNIQEANFQLNLRFTYNSRISDTTKAWQFSHKKFVSLPNGNNPGTLQEEDGHLTTYKQDPANPNNYLAQESVGGTKFMRFDSRAEYNCWILHDPETGCVEYYDTNGLLTKKTDKWGTATTYRYENGQLRHIVGPTGNDYEIRYGQNVITIYDTATGNALNIYEFDALGRLITSTAHGGYQTKYTYVNDSSLLSSVTQTDGTFLGFVHDPRFGVSMIKRGDGKAAQTSRITYADANNPNRAIITDSFNSQTTLKFNNDGDLTSVARQKGYNIPDKVLDVTQYTYTPTTRQLQDTVLANGGIDHREYNSLHCNLLNNHVYPEGQRTEYVYTSDFETRILLVKNEYLNPNTPLTTSYVYERVNDGINLNIFLRFVITPEGRVTEYRPDSRGNIETKRTYLKTTFPKNLITPKTSPDISVMLKWVSDQESKKEPNAISLEKYLYDTHGQVRVKNTYANVDANGNGIEDAFMGYQVIIHDLFGNLTEHDVKQDSQNTAKTLQAFDGVSRLTRAVDALKNATTTEYHDDTMQVMTTYANGKVTVAHKSNNGLTQTLSSSAKNLDNQQEYREYDYSRDTGGRIEVTQRPDGKQIYSFYDRQNRLGYTVSALGIVTEYQYDKQNRFNTAIEYASLIDLSQLQVPPPLIPPASTLINLVAKIKDPTKDHQSYTFFDKSGRKLYDIDADNYVTQYFYDNLDRRVATIQYATKLSDANLVILKSGGVINLPQDFAKDRVSRSFWDNDGLLIGKQDAAGFVTQLVRDAGGRITGKLVYYTKANLDLTLAFDQIIHQVSQGKIGVTYYEHDARGQIIAKLNPEGYYTEYTYSPNGLRLTAKLYANKPAENFPSRPAPSVLDQLRNYEYDLLGRKTKTTSPFNRVDNIHFDVMGNIILNNGLDSSASQSTDGDHLRQTATQFDGWNQTVNKANVYVGQLLAEAGNDQTKIQQIWANQSQRNKYDQTGLLLSTTDPLGNTTYIYYDLDRRPVLKINANLSIEESVLDNFGKEIQSRKYANFYDMSLGALTGGFLTADFQAKIIGLRNDLDHIIVTERDKRGNIIKITDAENNITQKSYNAFGQIDTELLPVNSANPTLQIQHGYDTRGNQNNLTKTDLTPGSTATPITESWEFNNPLNKKTKHTNTLGGIEEQEHDLLGNVTTEKTNGVIRKTYTHDFINRVLNDGDAFGNTTKHEYGADHTHTVTAPKGDAKLVSQLNVFEEVVQETDAESNTTETSHVPDGQVSLLVDPLQNKTAQEFDLLGQKKKHVDAILVETAFDYTSVGFVDKVSNDAKSPNPQSEKFGRDAFGNAQQTTDPRLTNSKNEFNKNNNLKKTTTDVGGLNLVKAMDYNAQGKQKRVTQTDVAQSAAYVVDTMIDGFNRDVGKIVDPTTLKITTTKILDASDNIIRLIDPSGNITRNYFNTLEQKRFRVTPTGGLRERFYDENGRIRFKRVYNTKIQVTNDTTFDQIKTFASQNKSTDDGLLYYFYDENGNEKYRINSMGFVSESIYNNANPQRVIKTTLYYTAIDPTLLTPDFKTSDVASKITVDPKDRSTFYGRDAKGQVTTKVDGEGYVTAQQFNKLGKPIVVTRYANPLAKPIDPKILPLADSTRDRVTYYVYDNLGRRTFQVELMDVDSNKGRVTKYTYDENNNPTQTIKFNAKMVIDTDYQNMVEFLNRLIVSDKDDVQTHAFDKANRLFKKINGLGKYDEFTLDCLGLSRKHKNRNGYEYGFEYDGAKRLKRETSPEVNVASVAKSISEDGIVTLTSTQTSMTVDDTKDYYDNGKIKTVTKGANTNTPRSQSFTYDGMSQLASTKIDGVNVDDPSKDSSYVNTPTQTQSIETKQVTNAKNLIVAKQDESLRWSFSVYNSEGFEVYAVGTDGSVHQTIRNAFQEVIGEVLFAEETTLDLSQYIATGIPLNILEADMAPKLNNPKNRVNKYTKDNVGNTVLAETGGPTVYYALVNGEVKCAIATPVTKFEYNAFKERTYRRVLQYPTADQKGVWSEEFWWCDKVGNYLAHLNTNGRVDAYAYDDAFHKYTKLSRWAVQLTQRPTSQTTYAQLMSYYQADPSNPDHQFERDYDVIGREIADRQLNAVVQVLVFDPKTNEPTLQNLPPKTLEKKYEWDALDNKVMITYLDGGKECHYFDARNDEIAQTKVTRTSQDENGAPVLITPLTYFGRDAFRQKVTTTKFKLGTSVASPSVFPQPLALSIEDQETVKLFDIRGLTSFTSDAEKRVMGHTFTPTRKIARSFGYLTDPMPLQGPVRVSRHIDDIRYLFGLIDKPVRESHYRDNQLQWARLSRYNFFGEIAADGRLTDSGGEDYFSYYDRDPTGKIWRTNSKDGVDTLSLRNLAGYEGLSAQSVKKGLIPSLDYANLPTFLSADTTDIYTLERKQTERDQANRSISTILPGYEIPDPNNPQNITMSAVVGNNYPTIGAMSISWELPAVTTCVPSFQIWPVGNPNNKQTLVIKTDGNRSGVDVSTLPTDVYAYAINYDLKNSDGSDSHKLQYQVQGEVQFDTKNTSGSQRLVIDIQNDNSLILTGNTTNLTAIKLFQNNVQVGADIPVTIGQPIDLSKMASGVYTVQPVVTGQQNLPQTLPFTIYTSTPSATPLSREIDATTFLKAVNYAFIIGRGQLVWNVSKPYDTNAVNVTVAYKDENKQARTYKTTITKETNYGTFQDQHGNVLTANIQFPSQVSEILNLTVSLDIGNGEEICILNNYKPVTESGDGTSYMINAAFSNTTTLYISSEIPYTNPPVLDYLDVSTGVRPQWKALQSIGRTREGFVVDATGIPDGNYSYTVGQSIEALYQRRQEKSGEAIKARHDKQSRQSRLRREKLELDENEKTNVFTIGHGAEVYSSTPGKNLPPVLQVPVFTKAYDNFDKIKSQTDTLGNTTAFRHDVRNKKVLEISPKVDVQNEDGTVTKDVQPQTAHGYNERGFKIGVTDGNGHTTGFGLDEAGQLVQSILPSGLIEKTQVFDALERRVAHIDTRKNKYTVTFDRCDNQTSITDPNGDKHLWEYDEKNSMSAMSDVGGNRTLYLRDVNGNITKAVLPLLENGLQSDAIEYQYDLLTNRPIYQRNPGFTVPGDLQPLVKSQAWHYDAFGNKSWHQDLSGAQSHFERDGKNQVVREWSEGGDHGQTVNLQIETVPNNGGSNNPPNSPPDFPPGTYSYAVFTPIVTNTPNKDLHMDYRPGGLLQQASDASTGKECFYDYDASGRQSGFEIYRFGNLLRSLQTNVDALNREVMTVGPSEMITKGWDRTNNIVSQNITLYPITGNPIVKNLWNSHDADDRVLIYGGTLQGNVIVRGDDGEVYTYQNGLRQTQNHKVNGNPITDEDTVTFIWDVNSRLKTGNSSLNYNMQWTYDSAARPSYFALNSNGTPPSESVTTTYDPNWWITKQVSWSYDTTTTTFNNFDGYGNPWSQFSHSTSGGGADTTLTNQYVYFDDPLPSFIGGTLSDQYGTGAYSTAQNFFTVSGGIAGQRGVQDKRPNAPRDNNDPSTNVFETDVFDRMLTRWELFGVDMYSQNQAWKARKTDYFYDFAFNLAGSLGEYVTPGVAPTYENNGYMPRAAGQRDLSIPAEKYYNQSNDGTAPGQAMFLNGKGKSGYSWRPDYRHPGQNRYESEQDYFAERRANFKIGLKTIDPISKSFPPSNTGYYVVRDKDTLESIAQAAYGDSSYASLIGEANSVSDSTLKMGDRLVLPAMFESRFNSNTSEPYQIFAQQIIANLYPIMDVPQPPDDDDSVFDAILDIIIVIVSVIVSGGNPLLAAAIAAETEAEVEAVEVALGMRSSFSLRHVAEIALEAGFSAGTGDVLSSLGKGITISEEVAIIGASAVTEQLTEMKLGLRDHFDLRSVLEQMATQAITSEIAPAAKPRDSTVVQEVKQAEDVVINTVVSGVVQEVFEGQMSAQAIENLAANAVGTEVGDAVGSEIESPQIQPQAQTNTPQSMPKQNVFERIIGDIETEITSAVDDIKELFDPKLVAPTAQKPAPSIAKKMSRQGIFAQRVNSENDDGIDLTLNPSYDKLNPAQLGKGLNLSDGTVSGSGVSRVPTTTQAQSGSHFFYSSSQATNDFSSNLFLPPMVPGMPSLGRILLDGLGGDLGAQGLFATTERVGDQARISLPGYQLLSEQHSTIANFASKEMASLENEMEGEWGSDDAHDLAWNEANSVYLKNSVLASRYGIYSLGLGALTNAAYGLTIAEIGLGIHEVVEASEGQRLNTGVDVTGKIGSTMVGRGVGAEGLEGTLLAIGGAAEFEPGPGTLFGAAVIGGTLGGVYALKAFNYIEPRVELAADSVNQRINHLRW